MFEEKSMAHVARSDGWEGIGTKRHKKKTPGMHPVHNKWWAHMHRVHTELVGPALGEMRWDNCLSEFFYLIKGTIVNP